jgi:cyclopropane fatty-acyl-phospholipid synthase-like methyltransferase
MSIKARLFDQFRRPRGPLGILAGRIMSNRSSNQQRSAWTVELLNLHPGDRVLELGYGPGLGIEAALAHRIGTLVGLDHSDTMRKMATKRIRAAHPEAKPDLRIGDVQALPDDIGVFDKIFSCNVWLFWKDPVTVFENLHEHLAQGGTVAVTHLPRSGQATRETSLAAAARITEQLTQAGYSDIRQELLEVDRIPAVCILATQP